MRKLIFSPLSLGLFLALGAASFGHAESLKETYQQALANDHTFKAAQAKYEAGKENKAIGRANLLPNVNFQGSWSDSSGNSTETEEDTTVLSNKISLVQPIINFAAWHSFKRGAALTDAAEAQLHSAEQELIVRTAEAYFEVLKAADSLETARAEANALSHQLEQTKQRFEVGLTAITEVHEAQAAFDSATAARLIAEGQIGIAFEGLEVITGKSYSTLAPLRKNFPVTQPEPLDRNEWVQFALSNNFSLKAAASSASAAKQYSKIQRSGHLPTLSGSISYQDNTVDIADFNKTESDNQTIALVLNVPLFAGGGTSASRRQAASQALQAREEYNQAQRDVIQQTRTLHLSVVTGVATVKARAQAITSSQSALDATQAGYEVGTRDLVDVLSAQRNLYLTQRNYLETLYGYVLSTLRLQQAAGILTPAAIDELDNWLDKEKSVQR